MVKESTVWWTKGCRNCILWQSGVTSTVSWFQGHIMYIHLDYRTLPLGEGEKHFAYVEITGGRQGSLLQGVKKISSKLPLWERTGPLTYPWVSKVSHILSWCSSNHLCPIYSKYSFWLQSLTRPQPCVSFLLLLAKQPKPVACGCVTANGSRQAAATPCPHGAALKVGQAKLPVTKPDSLKRGRREKLLLF